MFKNILIILMFLFGIVVGTVMPNWISVKAKFYDIRLIELIQLFITIIVAVFITYLISTRISYNIKKKEMHYDFISKFQDLLTDIIQNGYNYIDKPDNQKERIIKRLFKDANIRVGIMININNADKKFCIDASFYSEFVKLKETLTDTPFGQKLPKYSEDKIKHIEDQYGLLMNKIYECKLKLYS